MLALGICILSAMIMAAGGSSPAADKPAVRKPGPRNLTAEEIAVIGAGAARLSGKNPGGNVVLENAATTGLSSYELSLSGFRLKTFDLIGHTQIAGAADTATLGALLGFVDQLGRRADVVYTAEYKLVRGKITVQRATVASLYSPPDAITAYFAFVPSEKLRRGFPDPNTTFLDALAAARDNAVGLNQSSAVPSGARDYHLFVAFLDRIAPAERIEIRVAASADGLTGEAVKTRLIDEQGWRVLIGQVRLDLKSGRERVFKAIEISQGQAGQPPNEQLVGFISTRPSAP